MKNKRKVVTLVRVEKSRNGKAIPIYRLSDLAKTIKKSEVKKVTM